MPCVCILSHRKLKFLSLLWTWGPHSSHAAVVCLAHRLPGRLRLPLSGGQRLVLTREMLLVHTVLRRFFPFFSSFLADELLLSICARASEAPSERCRRDAAAGW